jgi:hypothetical protein
MNADLHVNEGALAVHLVGDLLPASELVLTVDTG